MKRPLDRQSKINLYFLSVFILAALIIVGTITYKDVRYSRFDLSIEGTPTLSYDPLNQRSASTISPSSSNAQYRSYDGLPISWWADKSPAYRVDKINGLWFKATPTMNGDLVLNSPADGPLNAAGFDIRNPEGKSVDVLVPGQWYKIKQYGQWYSVEFQWDK